MARLGPDPDFDARYPEHAKLTAISDKSQLIYDFLSWAQDEKDAFLYEMQDGTHGSILLSDQWLKEALAEFFGIDLDKIEAEKRAMLASLRAANDDN